MTSHRHRHFGLKEIYSTMKNMYLDSLSRSSIKSVAGGNVTMQATNGDLTNVQRLNCDKSWNHRNLCGSAGNSNSRDRRRRGNERKEEMANPSGAPYTSQRVTAMSSGSSRMQ